MFRLNDFIKCVIAFFEGNGKKRSFRMEKKVLFFLSLIQTPFFDHFIFVPSSFTLSLVLDAEGLIKPIRT